MRFEQSADIDTSPQRAWDVLSDLAAWPRRTETVQLVELLTPAPLGMGSRIRLRQTKMSEGTWDVTVWDAPTYFELRQASRAVTSVVGHRVDALDDGRSRLTLTLDITGLLTPVVALFAKGVTERQLAREAHDMKRAAEADDD